MDGLRVLRNTQVVILGVCIATATIVSSVILSQGFIHVMEMTRQQITVTGSANKQIDSDYVVWRGSFSIRDADLATGYKQLSADLDKVKEYLTSKGVKEDELTISQITIEQLYKKDEHGNDTNEFMDNRLTQLVEVRSEDVAKVTQISREITELINQGVQFNSGAPDYFYRQLDGLKVEMLARATENAKQRAENMARATGNKIGAIRSARMGVFQITPSTSTEVSDMGINDTSSPDKKVTAVVTASFAIE
ncbi:MAG TPA: SIMPL domain-containing protein [Verrucomicrobiae bacterium]|nr:SIMPL domain-containing protein [Verrucomicrobiae bacterium]